MKKALSICLILLFIVAQTTYGKSDKEKAYEKGIQAVKLEDEGKYDEALKLLNEAHELDPENHMYPYEIGLNYYMEKDYQKAISEFKKVLLYKDVTDQTYQMLGNAYDINGDSSNAFKIYDEGIKRFPKSGRLYLEKGNVYWNYNKFGKALPLYEKGIEVDPVFPSNYYRATRIYCGSTEEVWGMIYGEIFMNLERNSKRTAEISKLIFDTYKSEIKFTSDTSASVSFCQNLEISAVDAEDLNKVKMPFGLLIYEPTLLLSIISEKAIDINSLDRIRKNFVVLYFEKEFDKKYPNILFDFQNKILKAGHLEAYNHWILMKGDEEGFKKWQSDNEDKWNNFIKWFTDNELKIDDANKFYRFQY